MKTVQVQYIESGTFQGGEENVFNARIEYDEDCIVVKKGDFKRLVAALNAIKAIAKMSPVDGIEATSLAREVLK